MRVLSWLFWQWTSHQSNSPKSNCKLLRGSVLEDISVIASWHVGNACLKVSPCAFLCNFNIEASLLIVSFPTEVPLLLPTIVATSWLIASFPASVLILSHTVASGSRDWKTSPTHRVIKDRVKVEELGRANYGFQIKFSNLKQHKSFFLSSHQVWENMNPCPCSHCLWAKRSNLFILMALAQHKIQISHSFCSDLSLIFVWYLATSNWIILLFRWVINGKQINWEEANLANVLLTLQC